MIINIMAQNSVTTKIKSMFEYPKIHDKFQLIRNNIIAVHQKMVDKNVIT